MRPAQAAVAAAIEPLVVKRVDILAKGAWLEDPVVGADVVDGLVHHLKNHGAALWLLVLVDECERPFLVLSREQLVAEGVDLNLHCPLLDIANQSHIILEHSVVAHAVELDVEISARGVGHVDGELVHALLVLEPSLFLNLVARDGDVVDVGLGGTVANGDVRHVLVVDPPAVAGQPQWIAGNGTGLVGPAVEAQIAGGAIFLTQDVNSHLVVARG